MSCELDVDSDVIRQAASFAARAAEIARQPADSGAHARLRLLSCEGSATIREALSAAVRCAHTAVLAGEQLAASTDQTRDALDQSAGKFDEAERLCTSGW